MMNESLGQKPTQTHPGLFGVLHALFFISLLALVVGCYLYGLISIVPAVFLFGVTIGVFLSVITYTYWRFTKLN
jgi:hypothetical protein